MATKGGDFADPFMLRVGDAYFAFATGTRGQHLQVTRSRDLAEWTPLGDPLPRLPAWARNGGGLTWAPSVLSRRDGYVLYYTTRDSRTGFQCISRAVSGGPGGPYVDGSAQPMICQAELCGSIDPSPFVDRDGAAYLLWKSDENALACRTAPRIWSQRLSDDGRALVGRPRTLLERDRPWEGEIVEGPSMALHDGRYYLFYSANWYASSEYAIGYATCEGPTGGCTKVTTGAPFLASSGGLLGPGGQELFTGADGGLWMAYHAWTAPRTTYQQGGARSLRLARIDFRGDGQPQALAVR
ncbi:MAG TPA: glycoside hydrolase family 43 protein [Polyangia bacterium]|nr:glycoside hydrolase family 43 protein [Polyangia bacterium]